MMIMYAELVGEIVWTLAGFLLLWIFGWTLWAETMVLLGLVGLASWPFRYRKAKRQLATDPPPTSN
jgi:hypothetical protein